MAKTTFGTNGQKKNRIAFCGLYCEECGRYERGKCPGCSMNEKATWCAVRKCCLENDYDSCADCTTFASAMDCRKFNNPVSKIFGFIFNSDRGKCIAYIKKNGYPAYAEQMDKLGRMSMKRKED
ncbi:MAG TPA: DUF3795 domain-containing protein [Spirochaetota bacterium]|nr:DUF3795 domain-containing protein [Spirochaetota bacterium]